MLHPSHHRGTYYEYQKKLYLYLFFVGCDAPLGMESRKIRDNQITASTYSTGINMKPYNARLNNNGAWCVKKIENYVVNKMAYNLPSEFLGRYKSV